MSLKFGMLVGTTAGSGILHFAMSLQIMPLSIPAQGMHRTQQDSGTRGEAWPGGVMDVQCQPIRELSESVFSTPPLLLPLVNTSELKGQQLAPLHPGI